MDRRSFLKTASVAGVSSLAFPSLLMFEGCAKKTLNSPPLVDQIIAGLKVADSVTQEMIPIISPVNPAMSGILAVVSADLERVIKTYNDYDSSGGIDPTKADLIRSTATAIQANLREILAAIGVKNQKLITYVSVGVAIVNSALAVVLNRLPAGTKTQALAVGAELPTVDDNSPQGMKDAWNNAVKKAYPNSRI